MLFPHPEKALYVGQVGGMLALETLSSMHWHIEGKFLPVLQLAGKECVQGISVAGILLH